MSTLASPPQPELTTGLKSASKLRPYVVVTKRCQFAAAHHFWRDDWSEEKNQAIFGVFSNRRGHGHNYEMHLSVGGPMNASTSMVVNLNDMKRFLNEVIVEPFNFKHFNYQVDFFKMHQPTLEVLSQYCWDALEPKIDSLGLTMERLDLREEETLAASYSPKLLEPQPMLLKRKYHFSAAHRLYNPDFSDEKNGEIYSKCNNPNGHGHNYELELMITGKMNPEIGMLCNLLDVDKVVDEHIIEEMDHKHLNLDVPMMAGINPTAENIAIVIYNTLKPLMPNTAELYGVKVVESRNNSVEYYGRLTA